MACTPHLIVSNLAIVVKDAAEVEETCRTEIGGYLLRLASAGHMLHLGTVHHPQVCGDLKRAWSLGLGLGLWRQTCRLGRLVLGLFWGFLLSVEGHEHRLRLLLLRLLLLLLLLLRKGIVRPWWLHTMGDSGRRG